MKRQTICTDCGGTATIKGTPDDYEVICNHCDPRGPVVKKEYTWKDGLEEAYKNGRATGYQEGHAEAMKERDTQADEA